MAVLHCISISELCSTVHENFISQHEIEAIKFGRMQHMQFIAWNKRKIWKPKQYKIAATLPPRNILQLQLRN